VSKYRNVAIVLLVLILCMLGLIIYRYFYLPTPSLFSFLPKDVKAVGEINFDLVTPELLQQKLVPFKEFLWLDTFPQFNRGKVIMGLWEKDFLLITNIHNLSPTFVLPRGVVGEKYRGVYIISNNQARVKESISSYNSLDKNIAGDDGFLKALKFLSPNQMYFFYFSQVFPFYLKGCMIQVTLRDKKVFFEGVLLLPSEVYKLITPSTFIRLRGESYNFSDFAYFFDIHLNKAFWKYSKKFFNFILPSSAWESFLGEEVIMAGDSLISYNNKVDMDWLSQNNFLVAASVQSPILLDIIKKEFPNFYIYPEFREKRKFYNFAPGVSLCFNEQFIFAETGGGKDLLLKLKPDSSLLHKGGEEWGFVYLNITKLLEYFPEELRVLASYFPEIYCKIFLEPEIAGLRWEAELKY